MDFTSIGDLAHESSKHYRSEYRPDSSQVWGYESRQTWEQLVKLSEYGDNSLVPRAEALLNKLDLAVSTEQRTWIPSIYGAFPSVPDYLAGNPESMRRMYPTASDMAPITVWYYMSVSGGLTAEQVMNRGLAALALVLKLGQTRTVHLKLVDNGPAPNRITIDINTQVLSIGTLAFALTNSMYTRRIIYNLPARIDTGPMLSTQQTLRQFLPEAGEKDILIPGAYLGTNDMLNDPIAWIKAELVKAGHVIAD